MDATKKFKLSENLFCERSELWKGATESSVSIPAHGLLQLLVWAAVGLGLGKAGR
jgi:hypothetical protein